VTWHITQVLGCSLGKRGQDDCISFGSISLEC